MVWVAGGWRLGWPGRSASPASATARPTFEIALRKLQREEPEILAENQYVIFRITLTVCRAGPGGAAQPATPHRGQKSPFTLAGWCAGKSESEPALLLTTQGREG